MKSRILLIFLAVVFLSGCTNTFQFGIENGPGSTATVSPLPTAGQSLTGMVLQPSPVVL
jgi:hypothetical protein